MDEMFLNSWDQEMGRIRTIRNYRSDLETWNFNPRPIIGRPKRNKAKCRISKLSRKINRNN